MAGKKMLPKTPPPGLINSMCMRYAHDFGLDKAPSCPLSCGFTEAERENLRATMQQLYEEVSGHGFYAWPDQPDENTFLRDAKDEERQEIAAEMDRLLEENGKLHDDNDLRIKQIDALQAALESERERNRQAEDELRAEVAVLTKQTEVLAHACQSEAMDVTTVAREFAANMGEIDALKARLVEAERRFKMIWEAGRDISEMSHAFIAGNDVDGLSNYGRNIENIANAFLQKIVR